MSRYHPVRPKKDKQKDKQQRNHAPQSAAPTQPESYAEAEKLMLQRLDKARAELYKLRNGDILDESIARWKRMLAIYDREAEVVFNSDMTKPHRWTVSPSMALRAEKHLQDLLQRQSELMDACHTEANQIVTDYYERQAEGNSLCPPKQTEAPQAGFQAEETTPSNPSNEGGPPEAVMPAA